MKRIYLGSATPVDVDTVGRLLIPSLLREHAKLKREAIWAGNGKNVERWDKGAYQAARLAITENEERREEIAQRLAELGL
jgi:MraZ protein